MLRNLAHGEDSEEKGVVLAQVRHEADELEQRDESYQLLVRQRSRSTGNLRSVVMDDKGSLAQSHGEVDQDRHDTEGIELEVVVPVTHVFCDQNLVHSLGKDLDEETYDRWLVFCGSRALTKGA